MEENSLDYVGKFYKQKAFKPLCRTNVFQTQGHSWINCEGFPLDSSGDVKPAFYHENFAGCWCWFLVLIKDQDILRAVDVFGIWICLTCKIVRIWICFGLLIYYFVFDYYSYTDFLIFFRKKKFHQGFKIMNSS